MIKFQWHRYGAGSLLIILLATLFASAQQLPPTRTVPASAKAESKTGAISGRVITDSGQPLMNVNVYVRPATPDGLPVTSTATNREGVFSVTGLERGSYTVSASMPSYIPKSSDAGPTVLNVGDSVTLVLMKGGIVTGTVTNSKGDPVAGIGVRVEMVRDESDRDAGRGRSYDNVTDDRGVYRVYGVPTGTYIVAADGGASYSPTGVNAYANDLPTYAPSSNREAADVISVRAGEEISNVDIRYRGERGSAISGIVSGYGKEKGSWVSLTSTAERGPRWDTYFEAARGEFTFEGIPDGDYHLAATTYGNGRDRGMSESLVLNVRGADIEGLNLTAAPLASVSGRVVLASLKTPPPECSAEKSRPPFSEAYVSANHRATEGTKKKPQFVWRARGTSPDPQGTLTLQGLPANEYYFGVRFSAEQWYLESITFAPPNGKPTDVSRTWTTVKPGDQLSGLTVTFAQGGTLVRGNFALAEGQTVPEKLTVYLVPAETEKAEEALRYFAAPVNSQGAFWVHHVAPGRYWLVAQPGTDDTRYDVNKVRLPDGGELRSSLRHGAEQAKTEIELTPCQVVTLRDLRLPL